MKKKYLIDDYYKPLFVEKPRVFGKHYFIDINTEEWSLCEYLESSRMCQSKEVGRGYGGMGGEGLDPDKNCSTGMKGEIALCKMVHELFNGKIGYDTCDVLLKSNDKNIPNLKIDLKTRNIRYNPLSLLVTKQEYPGGMEKPLDKNIYMLALLIDKPDKRIATVEFYGWIDSDFIKNNADFFTAEGRKQKGLGHFNYDIPETYLYDMDIFYNMWTKYYKEK